MQTTMHDETEVEFIDRCYWNMDVSYNRPQGTVLVFDDKKDIRNLKRNPRQVLTLQRARKILEDIRDRR